MKNRVGLLLLLLVTLCLVSCQTDQSEIEEVLETETLKLQITPELTHWMPRVAECVTPIPGLAILTDIQPQAAHNLVQTDLVLRTGTPQEEDPFVALMGYETMDIIAGRDVPVESISLSTLQAIFSGNLKNWNEVPEISESALVYDAPIITVSYPTGHPLRNFFQDNLLSEEMIQSNPLIFSTSERLKGLLDEHPSAIAYFLNSQIPEGIKMLAVTGDDQPRLQIPVLAVTRMEPTGNLQKFLLCLQNNSLSSP